MLRRRLAAFTAGPFLRRVTYHLRRVSSDIDAGFFVRLFFGLFGFVLVTAVIITVIERPKADVGQFFSSLSGSFYWAVTTVMGSGDSSFVQTTPGYIISWVLVLFGVAIVATITGTLVGFFIDFLLKEGQGMGASGYRGHIVVCGWNSTARDLIAELGTDDYTTKIVVIHSADKNPCGPGVYYVAGDCTNAEDLDRAGIQDALAAIICPSDASNEADMRSILAVLAIESVAPQVRTVVEVNNPKHVEHFKRADADEILVTSRLASRLLARTSLYPGLTELVTDIVSGGDGSELYRVTLPAEYIGLSIDELSSRMRTEHRATLLAVTRNGNAHVNPPADFVLCQGDDAVVVAESLGNLSPLSLNASVSNEVSTAAAAAVRAAADAAPATENVSVAAAT